MLRTKGLLLAASLYSTLLLMSETSQAAEKLCSTTATQETVLALFKEAFYKDATAALVLDHDQTKMRLEAIRTSEQTQSRFACRASVAIDLMYKPDYERLRQLANPLKTEISYTVEVTDDDQQYVTLTN